MNRILILGGTQFIGRNLVERLLDTDVYEITLFNRQQTQAELFPEIHKIKGDRLTDDVKQIASKNWDYVIDLSCYFPESLSQVLDNLNSSVKKYLFISTCSVYDNEQKREVLRNEQAGTLSCNQDQRVDSSSDSYGNRKAECERLLQNAGIDYLVFRPALVYGKYDVTDRFYYWLYQVEKQKRILVPDNGERLFSLTYVDDLVNAIITGLSTEASNEIYNVITVPKASIGQIVACAKENLQKDPSIVNASREYLHKHGISQWTDMPLWIDGDYFTYNNQLIIRDLKVDFTSLEESIDATLKYYQELQWPQPVYGMSEEIRLKLLDEISSELRS